MGIVRQTARGKAGSLESMADPVNQNARLKVDSSRLPSLMGGASGPGGSRRAYGYGLSARATGGQRAGEVLRAGMGPLAAALWPARCLVCGEPGEDGRDLCAACDTQLPWSGPACLRCALPLPGETGEAAKVCTLCEHEPPPVSRTRAAFAYAAPIDRLLPRLKFHGDLAAGRLCARLMAECLAGLPAPEAVVAVPLHRTRLRERGYNQAREIAAPLARHLGLPLREDLLERVRHTRRQSKLDADARQANMEDAFAVSGSARLPAHVVLVDDVMTTGATLYAAAWALRESGVRQVDAWVVARAF
jgi:ComF family protein